MCTLAGGVEYASLPRRGRRGPLQTAFTTLELRELADLEAVDVAVDPAQLEGISDDEAAAVGKTCKQNIKVLRDYAAHPNLTQDVVEWTIPTSN